MNIIRSSLRIPVTAVALAFCVAAPHNLAAQAKTVGDIVATAKASNNYTTFAKLLALADLTSTFQGSAEFTVFAPTDAAFAKLPAEKLQKLEADTAQLKKVLLYHVVSGTIPANKVLNLRNARTMNGAKVEFSVRDARLRVNDAVIVQPDIKASNGIIHGIESVLMPK